MHWFKIAVRMGLALLREHSSYFFLSTKLPMEYPAPKEQSTP